MLKARAWFLESFPHGLAPHSAFNLYKCLKGGLSLQYYPPTDGRLLLLVTEEFSFWTKNLWVIFQVESWPFTKVYLAGLVRESCPPHTRPDAQWMHHSSWREIVKDSGPLTVRLLHKSAFLAQRPPLRSLFIWATWQKSSSGVCVVNTLLRGGGKP